MPSVKRVLKDISVETAQRKRKCHRKPEQHEIVAGERCLVVRDPAGGGKRNYCPECAKPILDRAEADLGAVRNGLGL